MGVFGEKEGRCSELLRVAWVTPRKGKDSIFFPFYFFKEFFFNV